MPASWVVVTPASCVALSARMAVVWSVEKLVALSAPIWAAERAAIWVSANSLTSEGERVGRGERVDLGGCGVLKERIWVLDSEEKLVALSAPIWVALRAPIWVASNLVT